MSGKALILGGGGPVGIAWESGLIAGLAESGINLSDADFIVGTSAGSVVGAQIALGRTPAVLVEPFTGTGEPTPPPSESMSTPPDLSQLVAKLMESYAGVRPNEEVCREIGAWALQTSVVNEEAFVASCAIASSCAVPGIASPISINGPFGANPMDFGRRPAAAASGIRQGKAGLDTLRELWG